MWRFKVVEHVAADLIAQWWVRYSSLDSNTFSAVTMLSASSHVRVKSCVCFFSLCTLIERPNLILM